MGVREEVLVLLKEKWGEESALLRLMLWERHGCPIGSLRTTRGRCSLYCDRCGFDFGLLESAQAIFDSFLKLRKGVRELK